MMMFGFCLYGGRIKWNDSLFDYKMPKKIILLFFLICIWIFNLSMMVSSCSCSPACALVKIDLKQTKSLFYAFFLYFLVHMEFQLSIIMSFLFVSNQLLHFCKLFCRDANQRVEWNS